MQTIPYNRDRFIELGKQSDGLIKRLADQRFVVSVLAEVVAKHGDLERQARFNRTFDAMEKTTAELRKVLSEQMSMTFITMELR